MKRIRNCIFLFSIFASQACFSENDTVLELSKAELNFLNNKQEIFKCVDPKWMPFESINNQEQHIGIIADIMNLVSNKIGIPITLVTTTDWTESHDFLKQRRCDIVTSDAITDSATEYFTNTEPFLLYKDVYITKKSTGLALNFEAISSKRIGFVKDYPTIALAKEKFPDTNIIEVNSVADGVLAVSRGDIHAFVDLLPSISYSIQKQGLTNLKVAGHVDIKIPVVMSVRNDQPELISIINKALLSITNQQKNEIFNQWVSINYEATVDYILILEILAILLIIAVISFYWINKNRLLQQEVIVAKERERIMRDMHDGVGGHLVAALALLEARPASPIQIKQCLQDCLANIRVVILSLDPTSSDLATLLGMFRHNISAMIKSAGIELIWSIENIENAPVLSSKDALNILRIMQEAITNVIKHSKADSLKITTWEHTINSKRYIKIALSDNGVNHNTGSANGYGIKNMKSRAKELNSLLSIEVSNKGTCVSLSYPI